jgi:hypothetical protein
MLVHVATAGPHHPTLPAPLSRAAAAWRALPAAAAAPPSAAACEACDSIMRQGQDE